MKLNLNTLNNETIEFDVLKIYHLFQVPSTEAIGLKLDDGYVYLKPKSTSNERFYYLPCPTYCPSEPIIDLGLLISVDEVTIQ